MKGRATPATLVALAALGVAALAYQFWNNDERQIRRMLDTVAGIVSHDEPAAGVGALAAVAGLSTYLAPDVSIEPGPPGVPMRGAQDVVSTAARLRVGVPMVRLSFENTDVSPRVGETARVYATATLTTRDRDGRESGDARGLVIDVRKVDGQWVIAAARVVAPSEPER